MAWRLLEMHYAASLAGGVLNAINFRLDARTVGFILEHAETKAFLVDAELMPVARDALDRGALAGIKHKPILIEIDASQAGHKASGDWVTYEDFIARGDPEAPCVRLEDEWQAITLNYTSGTTGNPKGVAYHHRGAYLGALGQAVSAGLEPGRASISGPCRCFTATAGALPGRVTAVGGTHVIQRAVVAERDLRADRAFGRHPSLWRADRARHAGLLARKRAAPPGAAGHDRDRGCCTHQHHHRRHGEDGLHRSFMAMA